MKFPYQDYVLGRESDWSIRNYNAVCYPVLSISDNGKSTQSFIASNQKLDRRDSYE